MTFLLVVTIYSVAVGEPSFGIIGPLAIGAALFAAAITGGGFTGAALNPARVLGELVCDCGLSWCVCVWGGRGLYGSLLCKCTSTTAPAH